jgi:hypothetical protein
MRKFLGAGVPAWELGRIYQRGSRHCFDKLLRDGAGRRAVRHATDAPISNQLADAGNGIAYDWARDAQGLHHSDWVRLIVRKGGDNTRLGQRGGHPISVFRGQVLDAHPLGNAELASESVKIPLIPTPSQDHQVGFRDLTHYVRQCLDHPVVTFVPL